MNDTYVTVQGWVGSDVTHDRVPSGAAVATFRLAATPRRRQGDTWTSGETAWFTVRAWRSVADNLAGSVGKGQPVLVHGRLVVESWQRPDESVAVRHVIEATSVGHDLTKGRAVFTRVRTESDRSETDRSESDRSATSRSETDRPAADEAA